MFFLILRTSVTEITMAKIKTDCLPGLNWYHSGARPIEYCLSTTCWASVTDLAALDQTSMRLSAGAVGRVLVSPWVRHQAPFFPSSRTKHLTALSPAVFSPWCRLVLPWSDSHCGGGEIRHLSPTEIKKYWINTSEERKETFKVLFSCGELAGLIYCISKIRSLFLCKVQEFMWFKTESNRTLFVSLF